MDKWNSRVNKRLDNLNRIMSDFVVPVTVDPGAGMAVDMNADEVSA
tara:strand:- start:340 stop:477 length:138 start_codon:yes stop_codon:yes gene_type:complete